MTNPLVSIIVPNYNGAQFLADCMSSVLSSTYTNFEVLFIDDASTDASLSLLTSASKKDRRIKIITNSVNLGASASRNKAIAVSKGSILVFLDNDTRVDKNWLKELVGPLTSSNNLGSTCSKTLNFQYPDRVSTAGLLLIPHTGWGIARGSGRPDSEKQWTIPAETVSISAALAVKKEVMATVLGFDEQLAVHTEDLDFCWRIWLAGYKILYVPTSKVWHWSKTQKQREELMRATRYFVYFHINKNTLRTLIKNYSLPYLIKYLPISILIIFARGIIILVTKFDPSALLAFITSFVWNLANIKDTLNLREQVQNTRRVDDEFIYAKIMSHESLFTIYRKYYS